MKKIISSVLAIALLGALLCACGSDAAPAETGNAAPPMLTAAPAQSGETAAPAESETPENNEMKALAEDMIGKTAAELIAAIGEPASSSFAPSCLGSGEDGEYIYEGFTVYTYREGETETVRSVE